MSKTNKVIKYVTPFLLLLAIVFMVNVHVAHADDDKDKDNSYTGKIPDIITDISKSPDSVGLDVSKGSDDAYVGDQWSVFGPQNAFGGLLTQYTNSFTYSNLYSAHSNNKSVEKAQGDAAAYGGALDNLGLDHSSSQGMGGGDIFTMIGRAIFGLIVFIGYALDVASYWVFSLIGNLAQYINIFAWISQTPAQFHQANPGLVGGTFDTIHSFVHQIYQDVSGFTMEILTGMLVIGIVMALFGRRISERGNETQMGAGLRHSVYRYMMKIVMIVILPIMALSLFTTIVNQVTILYGPKSDAAVDYAVNANLFDFGAWVEHSRLSLPEQLDDRIYTGQDSSAYDGSLPSQVPLSHNEILIMNSQAAGSSSAQNAYLSYGTNGTSGSNGLSQAVQQQIADATQSDNSKDYTSSSSKPTSDTGTMNMISSWFFNVGYRGSDYSSFIVSHMPQDYMHDKSYGLGAPSTFEKELRKRIYATNGTLLSEKKGGHYYYTQKAGSMTTYKLNDAMNQVGVNGIRAKGGLSTLGMYNYLNSVFTSTGFTRTEPDKLSTLFSTPIHSEVGLVGHGMVAVGNLANMLGLLYAIGIINLLFAMFTISSIINTVPKLGSYTFMSASLAYAVKLISGILIFGVEIIGGAFLCQVFKMIIISTSQITDNFISTNSTIFGNFVGTKSNVAMGGAIGATSYGLLNITVAGVLVFLSLKLVKWRGPILKSVSGIVEKATNTIFNAFEGTAGAKSNHVGEGNMGSVGQDGQNRVHIPGTKDDKNGQPEGRGGDATAGGSGGDGGGTAGPSGSSLGGKNGKKPSLRQRYNGIKSGRNRKGKPMSGKAAMAHLAGGMVANGIRNKAANGLRVMDEVGGLALAGKMANNLDKWGARRDAYGVKVGSPEEQKALDQERDGLSRDGMLAVGNADPQMLGSESAPTGRDADVAAMAAADAQAAQDGTLVGSDGKAMIPADEAVDANAEINNAQQHLQHLQHAKSLGEPVNGSDIQKAENNLSDARRKGLLRVNNRKVDSNVFKSNKEGVSQPTHAQATQAMAKNARFDKAYDEAVKHNDYAKAEQIAKNRATYKAKLIKAGYNDKLVNNPKATTGFLKNAQASNKAAINGNATW